MYRKASDTWTGVISPYAPSGFRRVLRNGLPDSVNTYNSPTTFVMYSHDHAGYIQDRWTPTRKLTLNLGLRLESTYASEPALCQEQTLFIAAQCFSEIEGVPVLVMPSPRFGVIYDVGRRRQDRDQADDQPLQPADWRQLHAAGQPGPHHERHAPRGPTATATWSRSSTSSVLSTGFNLGTTNRFADDLKWPVRGRVLDRRAAIAAL